MNIDIMQLIYNILDNISFADRIKLSGVIALYGMPVILLVFAVIYLIVIAVKKMTQNSLKTSSCEEALPQAELLPQEDFSQTVAVITAAIMMLRDNDGGFRIVSINKKNKHI